MIDFLTGSMLFESDGGDGELSFRLFASFVVPFASTREEIVLITSGYVYYPWDWRDPFVLHKFLFRRHRRIIIVFHNVVSKHDLFVHHESSFFVRH